MAITGFLESYMFGPSGFWTMAPLRYAAIFDPFLSLDCPVLMPSTLAQSKERKGSNFAIWQLWAEEEEEANGARTNSSPLHESGNNDFHKKVNIRGRTMEYRAAGHKIEC